jgi:hypothetical protein
MTPASNHGKICYLQIGREHHRRMTARCPTVMNWLRSVFTDTKRPVPAARTMAT